MKIRIVMLSFVIIAVGAVILSCEEKPTDYKFTDLYQITQLLNNDPAGSSAFPQVWIDTTNREAEYRKGSAALGPINPRGYWIEVVRHGRGIAVAESCKADEFNQDDTCRTISLDGGRRAKAKIALIRDTLVCRYHIVDRSTQAVTVKEVHYADVFYALMAKLNSDDVVYKGWALYGVGRERMGIGYAGSAFGVVDSIVVTSSSSSQRFLAYPYRSGIRYIQTTALPVFEPGADITVKVYTRYSGITDAYIHYRENGVVVHDQMTALQNGVFIFDGLYENSGGEPGTYSQIVVELLGATALRDDNPNEFSNLLWAVTYKIAQ